MDSMDLVEYVGQLETRIGELETRVAALEAVFMTAQNVNMPSDPSRPQAVIVDGPIALSTVPAPTPAPSAPTLAPAPVAAA